MKQKLSLKECKLWWPAWGQGIPFASYGYFREVSGEGYRFRVDPEIDSWLCPDGSLMPINSAVLADCDEGPIEWTSFTIMSDGRVQVNFQVDKTDGNGYRVSFYPLEALYFEGETFCEEE